MRLIARREYPHNGAQHLITDIEGRRYTVFATNTRGRGWTLPILELRHRQRARAEDLKRPGFVGGSRICEGWRAWQHHGSTALS